jgi:hypothetical protein
LGGRAREKQPARDGSITNLVLGAILGLLSLLLAFTYGFVAERHKLRQTLIVREANAIGTAYLRSSLPPDAPHRELQELLKQYLDSRILTDEVAGDQKKIAAAIERSEQLQAALWPTASHDIAGRSPTVLDSLVFQALNEVIDVHAERLAAAEYRLPGMILRLLCAIALTALFLLGFGTGIRGRRNLYSTGALTLLVTAVVLVIIALDSTNRGSILPMETRLIELRERLQAQAK